LSELYTSIKLIRGEKKKSDRRSDIGNEVEEK